MRYVNVWSTVLFAEEPPCYIELTASDVVYVFAFTRCVYFYFFFILTCLCLNCIAFLSKCQLEIRDKATSCDFTYSTTYWERICTFPNIGFLKILVYADHPVFYNDTISEARKKGKWRQYSLNLTEYEFLWILVFMCLISYHVTCNTLAVKEV